MGRDGNSQIQSSLVVWEQGPGAGVKVGSDAWHSNIHVIQPNSSPVLYDILEGTGTYRLKIESSGCNWWVKVGIETTTMQLTTNTTVIPLKTTPSQNYRVGLPTITLTYPNGGETWHVGDVVTIKWTSANLPTNTAVNISLSLASKQPYSPSVILPIGSTTNSGSFTWTVTNNSVATNGTGGYAKVLIETMGTSAISTEGFTIAQ